MAADRSIQDAAKLALDVQNASNLSGVLHSLDEIVSNVLWPEAHRQAKGTDYVNTHAIVRLFLHKLTSLKKHAATLAILRDLRELRELREHHAELICSVEERVMGADAVEKAKKNLDLVVAALEGSFSSGRVYFKVGKKHFCVAPGAAYQLDSQQQIIATTCIQSDGLPTFEVMAATMLLLKHNPTIFEHWRNDPGTHYGA